jgi:hypothetical protein
MARTKLSDRDRDRLLQLYRQPGVTVATLAEQFQVSNSTVSRILKESIPAKEYQRLLRDKRSGKQPQGGEVQPSLLDLSSDPSQPTLDFSDREDTAAIAASRAKPIAAPQRATLAQGNSVLDAESECESGSDEIDCVPAGGAAETDGADGSEDFDGPSDPDEAARLEAELFGEDLPRNREDLDGDDDEEDLDDNDLEEDDSDTDDLEDVDDLEDADDLWEDEQPSQVEVASPPRGLAKGNSPTLTEPIRALEILDLEDLSLPRQCFVVVDRFHELTTCPLEDFKHLGHIPSHVASATTLPIFDSHRVARRFSDRFRQRGKFKHRVIAFPGHFLAVTRSHLQAKGITHLLLDNQLYAL